MTATTTPDAVDTGLDISCRELSVRLDRRKVLHGVDLEAPAGSWTTVIGPNGAGKSTLVRSLAGLIDHDGTVEIGGRSIRELSHRQRARLVALVPQHAVVPPRIAVLDYVLLGRTPHQDFRRSPNDEDVAVAVAVLQRLDLESFAGRAVDALSGGERQRVIVARALTQDAPILLLDEPSTALDLGHQIEVLELIDDLRRERKLTVVSTLHDLALAGQFSHRVALLADGRVAAHGTPTEVLTSELIGRHYGVEVHIHHDGDGSVSVTVQRRREAT